MSMHRTHLRPRQAFDHAGENPAFFGNIESSVVQVKSWLESYRVPMSPQRSAIRAVERAGLKSRAD